MLALSLRSCTSSLPNESKFFYTLFIVVSFNICSKIWFGVYLVELAVYRFLWNPIEFYSPVEMFFVNRISRNKQYRGGGAIRDHLRRNIETITLPIKRQQQNLNTHIATRSNAVLYDE